MKTPFATCLVSDARGFEYQILHGDLKDCLGLIAHDLAFLSSFDIDPARPVARSAAKIRYATTAHVLLTLYQQDPALCQHPAAVAYSSQQVLLRGSFESLPEVSCVWVCL